MKWLVTYDLENDNHEESETLCPLPIVKRVCKIYFKDEWKYISRSFPCKKN